ncbi:hypothetical protein Hypma_002949 [Hypsizygus marmoreus]|uniref:Uncharacterized protein n=1 Tax=Hypsizygus marmoreus TaxID=39966 RepID=A0A369J5E1_HYPMA|nr:hypothetical protein Hypma_002949 [Hypsizygus marmoreus]
MPDTQSLVTRTADFREACLNDAYDVFRSIWLIHVLTRLRNGLAGPVDSLRPPCSSDTMLALDMDSSQAMNSSRKHGGDGRGLGKKGTDSDCHLMLRDARFRSRSICKPILEHDIQAHAASRVDS